MNIGNIVTPTARGQIVIPSAMRKILGINQGTLLQVKMVGEGIYLQPAQAFPRIHGDNGALLAVLKRVQGSWGLESPEEKRQAKRYRKLEVAASKRNKNAW